MTKLQSNTEYTKGRKLTLPLIGDIEFDENNCIFIEDDYVKPLLEMDFGIKLVKVGKAKEEPAQENKSEFFNEDTTQVELEAKRKSLEAFTSEELKELLVDFPANKTKNLKNKEQIINFLLKNI